ncbi:MAG: hypothetical protein ACTSVF_03705 [Candidatus Asgardarchaeia archaeon]
MPPARWAYSLKGAHPPEYWFDIYYLNYRRHPSHQNRELSGTNFVISNLPALSGTLAP